MDRLSDYDYKLPDDLIAQEPLKDRAASRMLVLDRGTGALVDRHFRDLPSLLQPGDLLVLNETRVTAVRLSGERADTGGKVELLVLHQRDGAFACLAKPARRLTIGAKMRFPLGLSGIVVGAGDGGERLVEFNVPAKVADVGATPLPPYIRAALAEPERYQTVYARADDDAGSAAAPTAGLHFTPEVLEAIRGRGIGIATVRLQVGIDTFRPVQTDNLDEHVMHGERCELPQATADAIAATTGRILAVGTTTVRTLETFARLGSGAGRSLKPGSTTSTLFLRPGSELKVVDGLLTNFHLPRTTMLMMLSALAGREQILNAYHHALQARYRFLSFGDSMLIL